MNAAPQPQRRFRRVARSRALAASALAALAALALPSAAAADGPWLSATTVGLGTLDGTVTYDEPVPSIGAPCAARTFDLDAASSSVLFNTAIIGHAGGIEISGAGESDCESLAQGSGTIALRMTGLGPTYSRVRCPRPEDPEPLIGTYERTAIAMSISVRGDCWLHNYRSSPVTIEANLALTPTSSPPGVTAPTSEAEIDGAFRVALPEESPLHPENMGDLVDRLGLG